MTSFKLVITLTSAKDKAAGTSEYVVGKDKTFIGRSPGNDVVLPDAEKRVSSKHARLDRTSSSLHLSDLGSTNGTTVNGRKIEANSPVELKNGDKAMIGLYQVNIVASEEELTDRTMVVIDPARQLAHLTDELPILYARFAESPPEQRRRMMRGMISTVLQSSSPDIARSILTQLSARFHRSAGGEVMGSDPTTMIKKRDLEAQQKESSAQVGLRVLNELSAQFVGEEKIETPEQAELFVKMVASVLELTFDWISKSLRGRREFEDQFSADLSMIFSKEKNPLKGGGGPADMGRYLLDWRLARDPKQIRESLDNAFKDLTMHQLGLLAGVQESLSAVLKRLDPKTVEQEAKDKPGGFLASMEKRAWKRYSDVFHEIFAENSKLFNELIYPNVRKGYLALHDNQEKEKAAGIKKGDTSTRNPSHPPSLTQKDPGSKTGG
jgi:type VI secretion system FHA domain protein